MAAGRRYSIPVQTLLTAYEERADKQSKRACMLPLVPARVHVASACACCPWCQRVCWGAPPPRVLGRSSCVC